MKTQYEYFSGLETDVPALSPDALARIKARARAGIRRRRRRLVWVAAALAALLTACTAAVATGAFHQWFAPLIPRSADEEAMQELFAGMGTVVGQSVTDQGTTLTLEGLLYDGRTLIMAFTLEGEDLPFNTFNAVQSGQSWLEPEDYLQRLEAAYPELSRAELEAWLDQLREYSRRPDQIWVYRQEDGTDRMLVTYERSDLEDGAYTFHLEDLEEGGTTIAGCWEFTFELTAREASLCYEGAVPVTLDSGETVTITGMEIYPFSVRASFIWSGGGLEDGRLDGLEIDRVRLADGTDYSGSRSGRDVSSEGVGQMERLGYWQAVDPSQVTAVQIAGTWVELSQMTRLEE